MAELRRGFAIGLELLVAVSDAAAGPLNAPCMPPGKFLRGDDFSGGGGGGGDGALHDDGGDLHCMVVEVAVVAQ